LPFQASSSSPLGFFIFCGCSTTGLSSSEHGWCLTGYRISGFPSRGHSLSGLIACTGADGAWDRGNGPGGSVYDSAGGLTFGRSGFTAVLVATHGHVGCFAGQVRGSSTSYPCAELAAEIGCQGEDAAQPSHSGDGGRGGGADQPRRACARRA
jgi:hypothetical protein